MHLTELRIWNFRKYGSISEIDLAKPNLTVPFQQGLNVLIGENDSGKTAILDAIKIVLKTHAFEWIKVEESDFYIGSSTLRIELDFIGFSYLEGKNFTEWIGWREVSTLDKKGNTISQKVPVLKLIYQIEKRNNKIIPADIKAGMDSIGNALSAEAREFLKVTYLKALRDADTDLNAKKNSRLSQILQEHQLFKKKSASGTEASLPFIEQFKLLNKDIETWFHGTEVPKGHVYSVRTQIKDRIDSFLKSFINESSESKFSLGDPEIKEYS
ncbi:AAA family ATPase [Dyadobacter fanqingshengii]|uniref:AAA family ATPase n=1 Tax=Dyadobacter fanqingshengii TaxID=2906443 RepID=A0A9X1P5C1_9BACT|nr:AAA family ATPase [Dyadobacter fanqingshengii]MCF0038696.1 AAA family ATPase [Dyadobacter fanqingshengii]USJ34471.1 AAA family ATPase [Dyadobacter fanqingshengii]